MALPKPPKDYYSLAEIAEEWEWKVDELVTYAGMGKIEISCWFRHEPAILCEIEYDRSSLVILSRNDIQCVTMEGCYPVLQSQFNDIDLDIKEEGEIYLKIDLLDQDFEIVEKKERISRNFEPNMGSFDSIKYGYYLNQNHPWPRLVITHKEKTRFEQEHTTRGIDEKISTCDVQKISKSDIGLKERGTWLKIIHLLAAKLADTKPSVYRKADGSFNASQFETILKNKAGDLLGNDDSTGNSGHGLSNDNLKKIFDEAEKLF